MPLTLWNGVCLCFLLVILSTVICSSSNVNTTCSAQPAKEGQLGAIDLYFQGIDFSADQFYIVLVKDYKDILRCGDYELKGVKTCKIPHAHGSFKSPGTADQNMTVIIPVVNHTLHHGIYVLRTHFNGDFLSPPTSCTFIVYPDRSTTDSTAGVTTVKIHTNATPTTLEDRPTTDSTARVTTAKIRNATYAPLKENQSPAVPIVVPTVLAVVIVAIVIAVIVVKRRKRGSYDQAPTADNLCEEQEKQ